MIERDSTDLPEPDSPTMPSVLPRSRVNDTPSTARTVPRGRVEVGLEVVDLEEPERPMWKSSALVCDLPALRCAHRALSRTSKRARTTSPR